MGRTKVLLADNYTIVRQGLSNLLKKESDIDIVAEVGSGMEAIEQVTTKRPDVILMDPFSMPGLNSLDLIRKIMEDPDHTRIVVLTMHQNRNDIREVLHAGVMGYLLKTSPVSNVIAAIRAAKLGNYYLSSEINADIIDSYLRKEPLQNSATGYDQLTRREKQIFRLIAEGRTTTEIAERLSISPKTVAKHRTNLMEKMAMKNTATMVRYAIKIGVVSTTLSDEIN